MEILTRQAFDKLQKDMTAQIDQEQQLDNTVLDIIKQVRANGDKTLLELAEKFDGASLTSLLVTETEIKDATAFVDDEFLAAMDKAKEKITAFHEAQQEKSWFMEQEDGIMLGQKVIPLDSVGVYIPGGKAAYPSSVLMDVIPAKIAGVRDIAITTPPQADGSVNPYVLAAADLLGVKTIYKTGGAQAIAALAYGTETVKKVAKIVGPGNAFVARAKKWVYGDVAIDMIAGPSEILVVADETAPVEYVAADLLSQAEHDESAKAICVTTSEATAKAIKEEVARQTAFLERKTIIEASIRSNGKIIIVKDEEEAFAIVNDIAPEHLQLMIANADAKIHHVKHAGAIFIGNYSPEPLGDYFAGPNHTLPTSGTAKFASPLGVHDFVKRSSIIRYSKKALQDNADQIIKIADVEGLTAHANSIRIRKDDR